MSRDCCVALPRSALGFLYLGHQAIYSHRYGLLITVFSTIVYLQDIYSRYAVSAVCDCVVS